MPLKVNISESGLTWKIEVDGTALHGKKIGDTIDGKLVSPELEGYELQITGGTDSSGFPMHPSSDGVGLRRVLLYKGWGFKTKPIGDKKKRRDVKKGMRMRKTVRANTIDENIAQLNTIVVKKGKKTLAEIFPDQNKKEEPKPQGEESQNQDNPSA